MADDTSFTALMRDPDFAKKTHPSERPLANEPWRTELQESHKRDLELQRETQAKQQRIKAAFPDAPRSIIALAGEFADVRDFLVSLIPEEE
ncbi:MAG: hypothetical protein EOS70_32625 [Mesorhizobium sp.]|uniref:hypothetical protein n=1 Tax=Mesorhizobium sp. TaxID=1871066 RepID=UPI000FE51D4D|nr:hypothetical protein [Mesorhizobium sp.]RWC25954.1 MAG: hypothetical protein EOS70_32625 [Mesorhizobium sp.]